PPHLGGHVVDILHGDDLLFALYNTIVKHLRNAVFDVAHDLMAICCVPEVLFHFYHIGTQHVISILFDVENDAVYVNDDGPVHFLVVLLSLLFCYLLFCCLLVALFFLGASRHIVGRFTTRPLWSSCRRGLHGKDQLLPCDVQLIEHFRSSGRNLIILAWRARRGFFPNVAE